MYYYEDEDDGWYYTEEEMDKIIIWHFKILAASVELPFRCLWWVALKLFGKI